MRDGSGAAESVCLVAFWKNIASASDRVDGVRPDGVGSANVVSGWGGPSDELMISAVILV